VKAGKTVLGCLFTCEEVVMKQVSLTILEIGWIAGTRVAGAARLSLLFSNRMRPEQRRAIG
jgi:hypothetical protein